MAEKATLARPYARAAFDYANGGKSLAAWGEFLAKASAVIADDRVKPLLGNPHVEGTKLVQFVGDLAGARDEHTQNFLRLLASNGRLGLLPEIADQYEQLRADVEQTVDVTVTTAMELTAEQSAKLAAALEQRFKRKVRLQSSVDANLIGGARVQAGDFVIDGSLKSRIERLAQNMTN